MPQITLDKFRDRFYQLRQGISVSLVHKMHGCTATFAEAGIEVWGHNERDALGALEDRILEVFLAVGPGLEDQKRVLELYIVSSEADPRPVFWT